MIVDDELLVAEALKRMLTREKYDVDSVLSGAEALENVRHKKYALAIIDKNMPGMSGIQACREIRKFCQNLAVILMTGESTVPQAEFLAAGGGAVMYKPFLKGEVQEAVHKALGPGNLLKNS